jgi:hypothetical protein
MRQIATYWPPGQPDGFGGVEYGPAELLDPGDGNGVRWEDKAELFRDADGQEVTSSAVVYLAHDVEIKGRLAVGDRTQDDPVVGREIRQRGVVTNLAATIELQQVWL